MCTDTTGADWLAAGSSVLGGMLGGKPAASGARADSIFGTNLAFDNSGWNVAYRDSKIESSSEKTANQNASPATAGGGSAKDYLPFALLFVGGLVAWKMLKK